MTKHAKLSASGASRWLNCPGSVQLESQFADTSSVYAQEGTLAHEIAELKLSKWCKKGIGPKKFNSAMEKFKTHELYQPEMDKFTDEYVDFVKEIFMAYPSKPYIELEERVDFSNIVPEGFGTADCIMIFGNDLNIIDLKYGKGVPVSPVDNPQLMLYALGAYNNYSFIYDIKTVTMSIVQPRLGVFESYTVTVDELLQFADRVKPIADKAYNGSDEYKSGDHCKFCKAKSVCKARAAEMFAVVEDIKPVMENGIGTLTPQEIGYYLDKVDGVSKWISDLEDEGLILALNGEDVTGFKAVEGRSIRAFKDIDSAFNVLLSNGYDEAMLYERKPLTLSKIEKLVGKSVFSEMLKDEIVKPPGKPTLVRESDKREKIVNNDANRMFNNLEKEGK